jgi:PTS system nitrogen regulatory IIA component
MDLKIKDVAELLSVSTTTIRRWLKEGKIPAYQLNHQYRFSKSEIEDWMMQCKLKLDQDGFSPFAEKQIYPPVGGLQQYSLYRAMHKGGALIDVAGKTKAQLIKNTVAKVAPRIGLDPDVIAELLLDREEMMSTALNNGVAIPHPRDTVLKSANSDVIITVFPEKPIEYGALDGSPVHTLFFLFSSSDKSHLHLLSKLAHLSSQKTMLDFLMTKPKLDQLLSQIKEWEAKISNP